MGLNLLYCDSSLFVQHYDSYELRYDVHIWMIENDIKYQGPFSFYIKFDSEEDAMAFKLKWL